VLVTTYVELVCLPEIEELLERLENPKYRRFEGAIGALDRTHIPAFIEEDK